MGMFWSYAPRYCLKTRPAQYWQQNPKHFLFFLKNNYVVTKMDSQFVDKIGFPNLNSKNKQKSKDKHFSCGKIVQDPSLIWKIKVLWENQGGKYTLKAEPNLITMSRLTLKILTRKTLLMSPSTVRKSARIFNLMRRRICSTQINDIFTDFLILIYFVIYFSFSSINHFIAPSTSPSENKPNLIL